MYYHRALALLDNIRKYRECRWETAIAIGENLGISAQRPVNVGRCMNCRLDIRTIKVQRRNLSLKE